MDKNITGNGKEPISLSSLTRRYRIILEESFIHERPENRRPEERRFFEVIPCKGFKPGPGQSGPYIAIYSDDPPVLQLYTNRVQSGKAVWARIKAYPGTWADFHLDGEAVIFFPATSEILSIVAEMAGGRRRRQLSPQQRVRLIEVGRAHRFKGENDGVQIQKMTQNEAPGPQQMERHLGGLEVGF